MGVARVIAITIGTMTNIEHLSDTHTRMVLHCSNEGKLAFSPKQRAIFKDPPESWRGSRIEIIVGPLSAKRSDRQNAYLHGPVIAHVQALLKDIHGQQFTHDETKYILKYWFAYDETIDPETGEVLRRPKETRKMNKEEFGAFIDSIAAWCLEAGAPLPDPESYLTNP